MKQFEVDFNSQDEDRHCPALVEGEIPDVGERVQLADPEGNRCEGIVRKIRLGRRPRVVIIYVELDYETWING